ncbi:hypothetical protein CEXT_519291 [Caerostris extrusa]|uniref:Uncharacterized protein n=1 Tax=Caerostris extrusa TaxID=172846 RepID=A0AAV4TG53_CAEEX|nr:hypothetical protein CEXT_519291 [Caerostris extrusa]
MWIHRVFSDTIYRHPASLQKRNKVQHMPKIQVSNQRRKVESFLFGKKHRTNLPRKARYITDTKEKKKKKKERNHTRKIKSIYICGEEWKVGGIYNWHRMKTAQEKKTKQTNKRGQQRRKVGCHGSRVLRASLQQLVTTLAFDNSPLANGQAQRLNQWPCDGGGGTLFSWKSLTAL